MLPANQGEAWPVTGWVIWSVPLALYKVTRLDQALTLCDAEAPGRRAKLAAAGAVSSKKGHGTQGPPSSPQSV